MDTRILGRLQSYFPLKILKSVGIFPLDFVVPVPWGSSRPFPVSPIQFCIPSFRACEYSTELFPAVFSNCVSSKANCSVKKIFFLRGSYSPHNEFFCSWVLWSLLEVMRALWNLRDSYPFILLPIYLYTVSPLFLNYIPWRTRILVLLLMVPYLTSNML